MLFKYFHIKKFVLSFLFILLLLTRFIKLDWGNGYFFNPDENNMAFAISQMSFDDLNPHFFAYGQFPLYLTFFSQQIINLIINQQFLPNVSFAQSILGLRVWSAIFSVLSVFFLYLISKNIFKNENHRLLLLLLIIFCPGLIQSAHFGTTESILIFVFIFNIFISQKIIKKYKFIYLFVAALISGIGIASKISAVILLVPIFLSFFLNFIKTKKWFNFIFQNFIFVFLCLIFAFLLSPYNLISFGDFTSSMDYEIAVATGKLNVFYTNQFLNTLPYIFQMTHIFPYTSGLPIFVFSTLGLFFVFKLFFKKNKLKEQYLLIFIPSLVFFVYQGQLFVKWTRFMAPIFFLFPLLSAIFVSKVKNLFFKTCLIILSILPGIVFLNLYLQSDVRVSATEWINRNLKPNSNILSESGNVINLPVTNDQNFKVDNFDFYKLDNNHDLVLDLSQTLSQSQYVFVPSRRVFKNYNHPNFPATQKYYQNLFSGNLGYEPQKIFSIRTSLILNPENAEETWTVFDQPTIRIFQKYHQLTLTDYQKLIVE